MNGVEETPEDSPSDLTTPKGSGEMHEALVIGPEVSDAWPRFGQPLRGDDPSISDSSSWRWWSERSAASVRWGFDGWS